MFFDFSEAIISFLLYLYLQGNAIGQSGLGLMYMFGKGVEKARDP